MRYCYVWVLEPFASGPYLTLMPWRAVDWDQYSRKGVMTLKLKERR